MRIGKFIRRLKRNKKLYRRYRKEVVFISGAITDEKGYKEKFTEAEKLLNAKGYAVLSPTILPLGMEYMSYIRICKKMIDEADYFYSIKGWKKSIGATRERIYAKRKGKKILNIIY